MLFKSRQKSFGRKLSLNIKFLSGFVLLLGHNRNLTLGTNNSKTTKLEVETEIDSYRSGQNL